MTMLHRKALVGVTGGIASGKSTVSRILRDLGVGVVDADAVARDVVRRGSQGLAEIIAEFGTEYLTESGDLNRIKLGNFVFSNSGARKRLNAITHPKVAALSAKRIEELSETSTPYIVYDVPLLIETGLNEMVDAVVVVAASLENQVTRCAKRSSLTTQEAEARISAQLPLDKKVKLADYVIHNDGTLHALQAQTHNLHDALCLKFKNE